MLKLTYTTLDNDGYVISSGLTASEAAIEVLSYDGHDYDVRKIDGEYCIYVSRGSRNSTVGLGPFSQAFVKNKALKVYADNANAAFNIMAEMIIDHNWSRVPYVIEDETYKIQQLDLEDDS